MLMHLLVDINGKKLTCANALHCYEPSSDNQGEAEDAMGLACGQCWTAACEI
jgi:hypothetical protein